MRPEASGQGRGSGGILGHPGPHGHLEMASDGSAEEGEQPGCGWALSFALTLTVTQLLLPANDRAGAFG